ncbi:response regulator transcription factor [Stagnihabitans tardus]|uniref:Response regulator n=1 Tax=Stagnihabitans tardus TaxID=2699202 RepID=A0AAE5BX64_9RHOB|nr:response regulator transcription factor [Stagnihabitans tardus]NBZ89629.1 response regulator [Stagnihabitans tardus]
MRILLADDQELVRGAIAAFLTQEPDFVVETAHDLEAALDLLRSAAPFDLVLLDYMMPGMNRLGGLQAVKALAPRVPVAILSGVAPHVVAEQAVAAGAAGFLPKTMSTRSLLAAVRFMAAGETYLPLTLTTQRDSALQELGSAQLTPREMDVLKRLTQGLANKEIARELGLQEVTVKLHVKTLYRKIGAKNRTQAALLAREAGLE